MAGSGNKKQIFVRVFLRKAADCTNERQVREPKNGAGFSAEKKP
jgi:hypothetical protein